MPTPEAEVADIVQHFLALVREHGITAELDGKLSMVLTAKPFLIVYGIEPAKNLTMHYHGREVFSVIWSSPDAFKCSISHPEAWEEAAAEMLARAARGVSA